MSEPSIGTIVSPPTVAIPSIVQAAQNYLYFAKDIKLGSCSGFAGDSPKAERDLSKKEESVYNSALNVLNQYFLGEMVFSDNCVASNTDDDDGKDKSLVSI